MKHLIIVLGLLLVGAVGTNIVTAKAPITRPQIKQCSPDCTCGCNEGKTCTCGQPEVRRQYLGLHRLQYLRQKHCGC